MPSSLNVQPAKRADAASLAAHAYRFGSAEDHVDRDRTHLNQVLHGPATFEATRAGIDALPDKQPNGRKIRTDANYTAQLICTFPEELDESQLDEWARETVAWAKDQAPGQLMYAVMHLDEGRPHIHMGIAAVEESGKLNYRALFGRESLNDPGENLLAMQKTYAARIAHLAVEPTQGKEYEYTGMNAWRLLKAKEEGRQEKAAELERAAAELNAKKEENHRLSGSLNALRQINSRKDLTREHEKQQASEAEKARIKEEKTAYNLLETARDNVITQRDTAITQRDTAITDRGTAEQELENMTLDFDDAFKAWGSWQKDAKEKAEQRDQAQGMMKTLARFVVAVVRGFSPKKWPAKEVERIANHKPSRWFEDEFFKSVGEKLNNLVDVFDTSQKTIPAKAPAPERVRAPTRAMDDVEQDL